MMYLKELLARIEKISLKDAPSPSDERQPEDKFLYTLPMELRKVWAVWDMAETRVTQLELAACEKFGQMEAEELQARRAEITKDHQEYLLAEREAGLLKYCFWTSVRRYWPELVDAEMIGIRKGWQVIKVNMAKKATNALKNLLKQFQDQESENSGEE